MTKLHAGLPEFRLAYAAARTFFDDTRQAGALALGTVDNAADHGISALRQFVGRSAKPARGTRALKRRLVSALSWHSARVGARRDPARDNANLRARYEAWVAQLAHDAFVASPHYSHDRVKFRIGASFQTLTCNRAGAADARNRRADRFERRGRRGQLQGGAAALVELAPDWRRAVYLAGLALVDGRFLMGVENHAAEKPPYVDALWAACWVERGRGRSLSAVRGLVAAVGTQKLLVPFVRAESKAAAEAKTEKRVAKLARRAAFQAWRARSTAPVTVENAR